MVALAPDVSTLPFNLEVRAGRSEIGRVAVITGLRDGFDSGGDGWPNDRAQTTLQSAASAVVQNCNHVLLDLRGLSVRDDNLVAFVGTLARSGLGLSIICDKGQLPHQIRPERIAPGSSLSVFAEISEAANRLGCANSRPDWQIEGVIWDTFHSSEAQATLRAARFPSPYQPLDIVCAKNLSASVARIGDVPVLRLGSERERLGDDGLYAAVQSIIETRSGELGSKWYLDVSGLPPLDKSLATQLGGLLLHIRQNGIDVSIIHASPGLVERLKAAKMSAVLAPDTDVKAA